jgi:hypothetical protein
VLLELGYAAKTLSWDNVICVYNGNYGDMKDLPFDLQRRRMCIYSIAEHKDEKAPERERLASKLREALDSILKRLEKLAEKEAADRILTPETAVAKVHEWLPEERYRIQLDRLVMDEANKLAEWIIGPDLPVQVATLTREDLQGRVRKYEEASQMLVSMLAAGSYYGTQAQEKLWTDSVQRVANYSSNLSHFAGTTILIQLRRYPALLLLYACGIAATAGGNYTTLLALLTKPKIYDIHGPRSVTDALHPGEIMERERFNWMLGANQQWYTPMSDHLFEVLRQPLKPYLHEDRQYDLCFDRFECMRALLEIDSNHDQYPTIGRFGWRWRSHQPDARQEIEAEVKSEGRSWAPFRAGWFGGQIDRFEAAKQALNQFIGRMGWH